MPNTNEKLAMLKNFLERLQNAEAILTSRPRAPVDEFFLGKIDEWASKILGISNGYAAEFDQMYKHRIDKARPLEEGHGDVTIGDPEDIHAKTVQLKSTLQDNHSQVNTMIKVALNQLSGERGEMPRPKDRLVVDMSIQNPENTWPGGSGTLGDYNYGTFEQAAHQKLLELCNAYRQHVGVGQNKKEGFGLSPATANHLTDVSQQQLHRIGMVPFGGHANSTQMGSQIPGKHWAEYNKVIHLTIKIRYHFGYPIKKGLTFPDNGPPKVTYQYLHKVVFNIFRVGTNLTINTVKATFFDPTGESFFQAWN